MKDAEERRRDRLKRSSKPNVGRGREIGIEHLSDKPNHPPTSDRASCTLGLGGRARTQQAQSEKTNRLIDSIAHDQAASAGLFTVSSSFLAIFTLRPMRLWKCVQGNHCLGLHDTTPPPDHPSEYHGAVLSDRGAGVSTFPDKALAQPVSGLRADSQDRMDRFIIVAQVR
jgi:hypothetical protein